MQLPSHHALPDTTTTLSFRLANAASSGLNSAILFELVMEKGRMYWIDGKVGVRTIRRT